MTSTYVGPQDPPDSGTDHMDQALFGYEGGHRLLSASTMLNNESMSVLSRLTDGTGAESYDGFDGYLSGYPLPGDRYALTRTWRALESSRPGAVWTHALIIDNRLLTAVRDPDSIIAHLQRPAGGRSVEEFRERPCVEKVTSSQLGGGVAHDWRHVLSALYAEDEGTVWLPSDGGPTIERDVLRIWWWQWPALRRRFAFCLGASGRRTIGGRDFDLLAVPMARKLSATADFGAPPSTTTAAGTLIDADLRGRMPSAFTSYLRFCGSETQRRSAAGLLSDIWMAAGDPDGDPTTVQRRLAARVSHGYPEPSSMRRLKRTLLSPDERLPARWTQRDSAALLISTDFGRCVRSTDMDISDVLMAVRDDPGLLLEAARAASPAPPKRGDVTSVADVLPRAARDALARVAEPTWLSEIALLGGDAALDVLLAVRREDHEPWARAFWVLDSDKRNSISAAFGEKRGAASDQSERSLAWIAVYAPTPAFGVVWLGSWRASSGSWVVDLRVLAKELFGVSYAVRIGWRAVVGEGMLVKALIEAASKSADPEMLGMLLLIGDPASSELSAAGLRPWRGLGNAALGPAEAAHLLRLAKDVHTEEEAALLGRAFAVTWEACARSDWVVWEALADYPCELGFGADWDRARRVARRFAQQVAQWESANESIRGLVLGEARRRSARAAEQLDDETRKLSRPQYTGLPESKKPVSNSKKKGKGKGKTPLDEARQLAADWLWRR